jgi:hypothetical protein
MPRSLHSVDTVSIAASCPVPHPAPARPSSEAAARSCSLAARGATRASSAASPVFWPDGALANICAVRQTSASPDSTTTDVDVDVGGGVEVGEVDVGEVDVGEVDVGITCSSPSPQALRTSEATSRATMTGACPRRGTPGSSAVFDDVKVVEGRLSVSQRHHLL